MNKIKAQPAKCFLRPNSDEIGHKIDWGTEKVSNIPGKLPQGPARILSLRNKNIRLSHRGHMEMPQSYRGGGGPQWMRVPGAPLWDCVAQTVVGRRWACSEAQARCSSEKAPQETCNGFRSGQRLGTHARFISGISPGQTGCKYSSTSFRERRKGTCKTEKLILSLISSTAGSQQLPARENLCRHPHPSLSR